MYAGEVCTAAVRPKRALTEQEKKKKGKTCCVLHSKMIKTALTGTANSTGMKCVTTITDMICVSDGTGVTGITNGSGMTDVSGVAGVSGVAAVSAVTNVIGVTGISGL